MQNNPNWKLVRLNFGYTPVHFGEKGIGLESTSERVSSDTLFSALFSAYARCYGKDAVEELLKQFWESPQNPPFRLSSTFVYRRVQTKESQWQVIYYLPKLLELPKNYLARAGDLEFTKTFKSLSYLPLSVWQRWYQGGGFDESDRAQLIAKTKKNESGYKGKSLDNEGAFDYSKAFQAYQLPKVAVDRTTRATNFYHTGLVQFAWKPSRNSNDPQDEQVVSLAGLYFLIQFSEPGSLVNELHNALVLLGEEGIGGERSSGAGRFQAEWLDLPAEWQDVIQFKGNHHGLISLFWEYPLTENLLTDATCYGLQERGGWIASPFSGQQQRRKTLQMFTEGSVFPDLPQGQLADVTPCDEKGNPRFREHKIYRSGIALSLPINILTAS